MKKTITKILTIILAVITATAFVGCADNSQTAEVEGQGQYISNNFNTEFVNTQNIKLFSTSAMTYSQTTSSASKELTAYVYPETATNKNVSWSIKWEKENANSVTNYVTITPKAVGSTTATVTCYKPFEGNIIITVTTEEGGYSAQCYVSFVGVPTEINIETSVANDGETYRLGLGGSYIFNISSTNPFNYIGVEYQNLEVTLSGVGTLTLGNYSYNLTDKTWVWEEASLQTVSLDSMLDKFMTMTYENGVATITTTSKELNDEYYEKYVNVDAGRTIYYSNKIKEFNTECYFRLVVSEPKTGLYKEIKLTADSTVVASVNLLSSVIF